MSARRFRQMFEKAGATTQGSSQAQVQGIPQSKDEAIVKSKPNKLVVGVAIGVGVISIVAIIYLLRKK